MTPTEILQWIAGAAGGGVGIGAGAVGFWKLFDQLGVRVDKREGALQASSARIDTAYLTLVGLLQGQIDKLTARLDHVDAELAECHVREARLQTEMARVTGLAEGFGDARQHAQLIISAERAERNAE